MGWVRGLLWDPMGPNIFARRRGGGVAKRFTAVVLFQCGAISV